MSTMIICKEIRKVKNGWILELRWPYGPEVMGYGEVVCTTWPEVLEALTNAADLDIKDGPYTILINRKGSNYEAAESMDDIN